MSDRVSNPSPTDPSAPSAELIRSLTGDLPCVQCGYNLRGVSVLSPCPECGTSVRATVLARVDPYASVLRPIRRPILLASGLLAWSGCALAAALSVWSLRAIDAASFMLDRPIVAARPIAVLVPIFAALSGLGAVVLVRPHAGIPRWQSALALLGVAAYAPLVWTLWRLHAHIDLANPMPFFKPLGMPYERSLARLVVAGLLLAIVVGLRANARLLASRSLLMRSGRVDRQTMLAMAAAVLLASAGDGLHLLADAWEGAAFWARTLGLFLIAVGSMLLTIGLVGMVVDTWRVREAILRPPLSRREAIGP